MPQAARSALEGYRCIPRGPARIGGLEGSGPRAPLPAGIPIRSPRRSLEATQEVRPVTESRDPTAPPASRVTPSYRAELPRPSARPNARFAATPRSRSSSTWIRRRPRFPRRAIRPWTRPSPRPPPRASISEATGANRAERAPIRPFNRPCSGPRASGPGPRLDPVADHPIRVIPPYRSPCLQRGRLPRSQSSSITRPQVQSCTV